MQIATLPKLQVTATEGETVSLHCNATGVCHICHICHICRICHICHNCHICHISNAKGVGRRLCLCIQYSLFFFFCICLKISTCQSITKDNINTMLTWYPEGSWTKNCVAKVRWHRSRFPVSCKINFDNIQNFGWFSEFLLI